MGALADNVCLSEIEMIFSIGLPGEIDVVVPCGPDMGEITLLQRIALLLELLHRCCHIDGVPHHDRVGDQIEAAALIGQFFTPSAVQLAPVRDEQVRTQDVERLAFIELSQAAASVLLVGIPPQDMEGPHAPSIFLEDQGQGVFLGIDLELLHQQGGGDPARF